MSSVSRRPDGLVLLCITVLAAAFGSRAYAEEYTKSYTVTDHARVRVHADDGSVHVTTADTPQVEFRVTYKGFTLGRNLHIDSRQDGDQVELTERATWGVAVGVNLKRVSMEVRMPRNAELEVETGDGSVEVSDVNGTVSVRTGDGSIKVAQLSGTIDLHTRDGSITADTLKGDLRLHTGDGAINTANLDGKCAVSSGDGSIHLAGRFDSLDIRSGDGAVVASVAPGSSMSSSWSIRTGDGPVDLALPADFKANLDATTGDGHISVGLPLTAQGDFSHGRVRGTMNGGGPALLIHTGDGAIRLKKS